MIKQKLISMCVTSHSFGKSNLDGASGWGVHGGVLLVATSYYCEWAGGGRWLLAASPAPGPAVLVAPPP